MLASSMTGVTRLVSGTPPALDLLREAIYEIRSRRRLVGYLVRAEMKKRGSDTLLGNIWWVLDPLLQMAVYLVFVEIISPRAQNDYPLFIFAAILPWKWFQAVVGDATTSVVRQEKLIRQIAFPKLILPVSSASGGVVGFAFGLIPLLSLYVFFSDRLSPLLVWIPVIAVVQYVFSLAFAIFVSAANVFFRDLGNVIGHLLRLWWFLSPGLYSLQTFEDHDFIKHHPTIGAIAHLNPFAVLFEAYRGVIYGNSSGVPGTNAPPDLESLALLLAASIVLLALVTIFFKRVEPDFAKVL